MNYKELLGIYGYGEGLPLISLHMERIKPATKAELNKLKKKYEYYQKEKNSLGNNLTKKDFKRVKGILINCERSSMAYGVAYNATHPLSEEKMKEIIELSKKTWKEMEETPIRMTNNETIHLLVSKYGLTEKEATTFISLVWKMKFEKEAVEKMKYNLQYKALPLMHTVMFEDALVLLNQTIQTKKANKKLTKV
jgi:hypothetical protein